MLKASSGSAALRISPHTQRLGIHLSVFLDRRLDDCSFETKEATMSVDTPQSLIGADIAAIAVSGSCHSCRLLNQSPFACLPLLPLPRLRTAVLTAACAVRAPPLERCLQPQLSLRHVLKRGCTSQSRRLSQGCPLHSICPHRLFPFLCVRFGVGICVGFRVRHVLGA